MPFDMDCRDRGKSDPDAGEQLARLAEIAARLGHDERELLLLIAQRLKVGRQRYGELHLATDHRDFGHEALAEMLDFSCYVSCALIRGRA